MPEKTDPSLSEIRALIAALPRWGDARPAAAAPPADFGTLGLLDGLAVWTASGQGRLSPRLERPRVALFVGDWDGAGTDAAARQIDAHRSGRSRLNGLCRHFDAELRVYEMTVAPPAGGLTDAACATAMAYGMMAVEDGLDLLCAAAAGPGVEAAAGSLAAALGDGAADPLLVLARYGGHALAALAGALIAARMACLPVILDGFAALAAGAALHGLNTAALDHCVLACEPATRPAQRLRQRLGKASVLDLGADGDAGCGTLLVLGLLRGAAASTEAATGRTPHSPS